MDQLHLKSLSIDISLKVCYNNKRYNNAKTKSRITMSNSYESLQPDTPDLPDLSWEDNPWVARPEELPDLSNMPAVLSESSVNKQPLPSLVPEGYSTTSNIVEEVPELSFNSLLNDELPSLTDSTKELPDIAALINETVPDRSLPSLEVGEQPIDTETELREHMWDVAQYGEEARLFELNNSIQRLAVNNLENDRVMIESMKTMSLHGSLGYEARGRVGLDYSTNLGLSSQAENAFREALAGVITQAQEVDRNDPAALGAHLNSPNATIGVPEDEKTKVSLLLRSFALGDGARKGLDITQDMHLLLSDMKNLQSK